MIFLFQSLWSNAQQDSNNETLHRRQWFHSIGGTALYFGTHSQGGNVGTALNISYEIRRNVASIDDDASFSISSPVEIGVASIVRNNRDYLAVPFKIPLLVDFNNGMHSTYNNIDDFGISLSAGGMITLLPNTSGELITDISMAIRGEFKFPLKRRNFSVYTMFGRAVNGSSLEVPYSFSLGALYLINYGN